MAEGKRDVSVDIVKGLGIACMVIGHSGSSLRSFVYLFHMAVFFIASGYCFKAKNTDTLRGFGRFVWRRMRTIWLPYVLWTTVYGGLHNFFIRVGVYTDNPLLTETVSGPYIHLTGYISHGDMLRNALNALRLKGATEMGGAFWFLETLLMLSLAYALVDLILKKALRFRDTWIPQTLIAAGLLWFGYRCYLKGQVYGGLDKVCSYYCLFHGGYLLRRFNVSGREGGEGRHAGILAATLAALLVCLRFGTNELGVNYYHNPGYLLATSFAGWQFLCELAHYIQKAAWARRIAVCLGQNTMAVVIFHFLSFKLVNLAGVLIEGRPRCLVAAFPTLYTGFPYWIIYTAVGLAVPVGVSLVYKWLRGKVMGALRTP